MILFYIQNLKFLMKFILVKFKQITIKNQYISKLKHKIK